MFIVIFFAIFYLVTRAEAKANNFGVERHKPAIVIDMMSHHAYPIWK
jgi:hypothetical protein